MGYRGDHRQAPSSSWIPTECSVNVGNLRDCVAHTVEADVFGKRSAQAAFAAGGVRDQSRMAATRYESRGTIASPTAVRRDAPDPPMRFTAK